MINQILFIYSGVILDLIIENFYNDSSKTSSAYNTVISGGELKLVQSGSGSSTILVGPIQVGSSAILPHIFQRYDGRTWVLWAESTGATLRIGSLILNEDGTVAYGTQYSPYAPGEIYLHVLKRSDDLYVAIGNLSTTSSLSTYKFSSTNVCSANLTSGQNCGGLNTTNSKMHFVDKNERYLLLNCYTAENVCQFIDTSNDTYGTPFSLSTYTGWTTNNTIRIVHPTSTRNLVFVSSASLTATVYKYSGTSLPGSPVSMGTFPISGTGSFITFNGYNGLVYIVYQKADKNLYFRYTDGNSLSGEGTLTGSIGGIATFQHDVVKFGTNKFLIGSNVTNYASMILTENTITNSLSLTTSSDNFFVRGFGKDNNIYRVVSTLVPTRISMINTSNLNQSSVFDITSGTGLTLLYQTVYPSSQYHTWNYNRNTGPSIMNVTQDNWCSYIINGSIVGIQKTNLLYGYSASGYERTTNQVEPFNSFIYEPVVTIPSGTSVSHKYSLNNGSSWSSLPPNIEISTPSATQVMVENDLATTDNTVTSSINSWKLTLKP